MADVENWDRSTTSLLPCPFCGCEPAWRHTGNNHTKSRRLTVSCSGCRVQLTNGAIRNDFAWLEKITAAAWNQRTGGAARATEGSAT